MNKEDLMDNERRVVKEAKRHPEHFVKLYDEYYPKLYAYVLSRVRHKERAVGYWATGLLRLKQKSKKSKRLSCFLKNDLQKKQSQHV